MNNLFNTALVGQVGLSWNENPDEQPAQSGAYQTRDDKHQIWIKYFDANYGLWYMSWAELKAHADRQTARICGSDIAKFVTAWVPRNTNGRFTYAVTRIRKKP